MNMVVIDGRQIGSPCLSMYETGLVSPTPSMTSGLSHLLTVDGILDSCHIVKYRGEKNKDTMSAPEHDGQNCAEFTQRRFVILTRWTLGYLDGLGFQSPISTDITGGWLVKEGKGVVSCVTGRNFGTARTRTT